MPCTFCMSESTKELGTRAHQSLTPPARELPCRQYNSSVPRLPLQASLPSAGCCGSHFVRQFLENIIAVLCLDVPRTMACCRQGSPLCCLRCRLDKLLMLAAKAQACLAFARLLATFAFSDGLPFAINNHRSVSRTLLRKTVMSRKTGTVKGHNLKPVDFWIK